VLPSLGRYELLGLLGRGGMAEVYLARRRSGSIEKRLVVKRVRRDRAGDARSLELLIREARLSMSLAHQNVVTVFDFGRIDDDVFLAMEHVEGRDLGSTLARPGAGPMPPVCAAHVAAQCCQALDHAHRRHDAEGRALGIVHHDVTPRNILISESGEVKLADFGVAGLAGDPAGGLRGTAAYMAPEQARGARVDARADLYALGLVLWESLAGRRARAAATVEGALAAARDGTAPPSLPDAPAALTHVIARATESDPALRYPSARDMLIDLDGYLVAARAAEAGPTLNDRLADWFARAWAGAPPALMALPEGALATFGDGATLRSMMETATGDGATEGPPAPAPDEPIAPLPVGEIPSAPTVARRRPWQRAAAIGVALVAAGAAVGVAVSGIARPRAPITAPPGPAVPSSPLTAAPPAASPLTAAPLTAAPLTAAPLTAAASDVLAVANQPARPSLARPARAHAGSARPAPVELRTTPAEVAPPIAAAPRAVTIGSQPWANFTIDDDPSVHQTPETVRLPPGPHRFHFHNPQLDLDRTIDLEVPTDRDLRHVERLQ